MVNRLNVNPSLKDVRVRKALAFSIDRKLLVEKLPNVGITSFTPQFKWISTRC